MWRKRSGRDVCGVAARQHVSRLCLASGRVLVESGSAGYLGQVEVLCMRPPSQVAQPVVQPGSQGAANGQGAQQSGQGQAAQQSGAMRASECYECRPKPHARSFPACTIRNTPTEPVHCIVWAKYLFKYLPPHLQLQCPRISIIIRKHTPFPTALLLFMKTP